MYSKNLRSLLGVAVSVTTITHNNMVLFCLNCELLKES